MIAALAAASLSTSCSREPGHGRGELDPYPELRVTSERLQVLGATLDAIHGECGAYPCLAAPASCDAAPPAWLQRAAGRSSGRSESRAPSGPLLCDGWGRPFGVLGLADCGGSTVRSRVPTACREQYGERWSEAYLVYSAGRNGRLDCALPIWDSSAAKFVPSEPRSSCRCGPGAFRPSDPDCDTVLTAQGWWSHPRGPPAD